MDVPYIIRNDIYKEPSIENLYHLDGKISVKGSTIWSATHSCHVCVSQYRAVFIVAGFFPGYAMLIQSAMLISR